MKIAFASNNQLSEVPLLHFLGGLGRSALADLNICPLGLNSSWGSSFCDGDAVRFDARAALGKMRNQIPYADFYLAINEGWFGRNDGGWDYHAFVALEDASGQQGGEALSERLQSIGPRGNVESVVSPYDELYDQILSRSVREAFAGINVELSSSCA